MLHNAAYEFLALKGWRYERQEVEEGNLAEFIAQVKADATWRGFSITMPLKQAVLQYLDHVDPLALATQAVNTVVIAREATSGAQLARPQTDGTRLLGYNTDVQGIIKALETYTSQPRTYTRALILGTGATSRSAQAAAAQMGITEVRIAGRSGGFDVNIKDTRALNAAITHADCVISTLPWTPAEEILPLIDAQALRGKPLLECAFPQVLPSSISGEIMLVHQAILQVELMSGVRLDPAQQAELAQAMLDALHATATTSIAQNAQAGANE